MRFQLRRPAVALLFTPLLLLLAVACSSDSNVAGDQAAAASPSPLVATVTPAAPPSPSPVPAVPTPEAPAPLTWTPCGALQCASLAVPLDYRKPTGATMTLAMIRLPARNQAQKIGSLIVNFGGPGGSGLEYLPPWSAAVPGAIRDRFDLVSFDPRGIGDSEPVKCNDNIQTLLAMDPTPDSPAEWTEVEQLSKAFAELCGQRAGAILPHVGTINVVRDLDQMRRAVGDEKLTYLGYSYGTAIGAVYAELFPERVRALVLDGVMDISLDGDGLALGQALGFEGALDDFVAYCAARACITSFATNPEAGIQELLRRVEAAPLPAPGADRPAGPGETLNAIIGAMYTESYWPMLARAVNAGLAGNGTELVQATDLLWQRNSDRSYPNLFEGLYAVNCLDDDFRRDPAHYRALAVTFAAKAPIFGSALAEGELVCAFWTAPSTPLPAPTTKGAPPIVLIGTTRDPATPYEWAVSLAEKLESAVLITNRGPGHTAYLRSSSCITEAVNKYFIDLVPPPDGLVCGDPEYATPIDVTP